MPSERFGRRCSRLPRVLLSSDPIACCPRREEPTGEHNRPMTSGPVLSRPSAPLVHVPASRCLRRRAPSSHRRTKNLSNPQQSWDRCIRLIEWVHHATACPSTMRAVIAIEFGCKLGLAQRAPVEPAAADMSDNKSRMRRFGSCRLVQPQFPGRTP
jgi:hypothetical protein